MLKLAEKMSGLSFGDLMAVYGQSCLERGRELAPEESKARQTALAEQEFYQYLTEVFFQTPGARYAIWQTDGRYRSALRLEPYRDGLLLAGLETAPDARNKGCAKMLIHAILAAIGDVKIYSHIDRGNAASIAVHEACGFVRACDYAVYADGSVLHSSVTYCYE